METVVVQEFVNNILEEFQIVLQSCEDQLNVIKHFIVEQCDQMSQSILTDFDSILDIAFNQISGLNKSDNKNVTIVCDKVTTECEKRTTVCDKMICGSLTDYLTQEGEYIVDNCAERCDELTDFVLTEKNKIMDFAEKHCQEIIESRSESWNKYYGNLHTKTDLIYEESKHVLTSISRKYDLIVEFLQSECREIDQLSYEQYEESLKLLTECLLLNNSS